MRAGGMLRTALWAAALLAAGALLAGLTGRALAALLPAGGGADPLPVYTSLSLAAEDEPTLPLWQRYDPERVVPVGEEAAGTDLARLYEGVFWPFGLYFLWDGEPEPLTFERLEEADGTAFYLRQYPVPGRLLLTDRTSGRMTEKTGARLDLAMGWDENGSQFAFRFEIPGEPPADAARQEQAAQWMREELCAFLAGQQDTLLGISVQGWYSLAEGVPSALLDRLADRPLRDPGEGDAEARLQRLCEEWVLDVQIVRLENELLLTMTDRDGGEMFCVYYDARLNCVSGAAVQLP